MADLYRSTQNRPTLVEKNIAGYSPARMGEVTTQATVPYANRPAGRTLDPRTILPEDPRIPHMERAIKQSRRREQEQDRELARLAERIALLEQQSTSDLSDGEAAVVTRQFVSAVERARPILEWSDDWDGEGSPAYRAETLDQAQNFLVEGALALWHAQGRPVAAPEVSPGPDGTIDLFWRIGSRELLINVPVDADESMGYYGDDAGEKIKGELTRQSDTLWLFAWLAR